MQFNRILKYLSFGCVCLIIPVLAVATVYNRFNGGEISGQTVFASIPMVLLWGTLTFFSLVYILRIKLYNKPATFTLHLSFVIILVGALITHLTGDQGKLHLRMNETVSEYITDNDEKRSLPFEITLKNFRIEYYEGTTSPADFVSEIIADDGATHEESFVAMNRIFTFHNYRFYQSGYDSDLNGVTFVIAYDPYGIAVTYLGYAWFFLSFLLFFFQKGTHFRSILKSTSVRNRIATLIIIVTGYNCATASPTVLPAEIADEFSELLIYYNGRIAPLNSFANEFTAKIYGNKSYKGFTPEQVVTGWFFFYDDWKSEPFIKVKDSYARELLEINDNYACLTDFSGCNGFKLDRALHTFDKHYSKVAEINEKFSLISSLATGAALHIYPVRCAGKNKLQWLSVTDRIVEEMSFEQWLFIHNSLGLVAERIAMHDRDGTIELIRKIKKYQHNEGGEMLPSENIVRAEIFYNEYNFDRPIAMCALSVGLILFITFIYNITKRKSVCHWIIQTSYSLIWIIFLYLSMRIVLRWYISGHIPLSNGFETMLLMSWCSALFTIATAGGYRITLPFGFIVCGFTLLIAMLGETTPRITKLIPALHSPLLSVHVMVIMISYTLLALIMLNAIASIILSINKNNREEVWRLRDISLIMLYPAVFLLSTGIFIGAVWANISWGRYWGWDPKEVWALITLLTYSLPLHSASLKLFRKPFVFHLYCFLAFLTVITTYFGVNFFLGGLHSYA